MAAAGTPIDAIVNAILGALSGYPLVEGAVAILVVVVGLRALSSGRRDGPVTPSSSHEYPPWLRSPQLVDAMDAVVDSARLSRRQLEVLEEVRREQREQTQLLEMILNENVINPRRLVP